MTEHFITVSINMYNGRIMILALNFLILIMPLIQSHGKHRFKRHIVFKKSSKYFLRVNGKDNVINRTDIFAHGWGVRVNWDLPDTLSKRFKFFKRDIHDNIQNNVRDGKAAEGFSCIVKYLCEYRDYMTSNETQCGVFCGIGRIILNADGYEGDFFRSFLDKCDYHIDTCPYSFKHASVVNYE